MTPSRAVAIVFATTLLLSTSTAAFPVHAQELLTPEGGFRVGATGTRIGSTDKDLTFTPVAPCRIVDTRNAGGVMATDSSRSYLAVAANVGSTFSAQGGSNTNCGVAAVNASAVAINVTAVSPATGGFATVYPAGTTRPLAASVNYSAGAIVNNTVVVGIPNPVALTDFTIYTFAASHYVVDIVGYYSLPEATAPTCFATATVSASLSANANSFVTAPVCPAGYQATTPYCWGGGTANVFNTGSGINGDASPGNSAFCGFQNNSASPATVFAGVTCCRLPGK